MSSRIHRGSQSREADPIQWASPGGAAFHAIPVLSQSRTARGTHTDPPPAAADESVWQSRVEQARREGIKQGEAAGIEKTQQQLQPVVERMVRAIEQTAAQRVRFRHEAEQQVVALSVAIARRILHRELQTDPDALQGIVKAALGKLSMREISEVRVHPTQKPVVESLLNQIGSPAIIRVMGDPALEVGALMIDSVAGTLDASIDTQLDEINRGFTDLVGRR